jgi:hypothetical protein
MGGWVDGEMGGWVDEILTHQFILLLNLFYYIVQKNYSAKFEK